MVAIEADELEKNTSPFLPDGRIRQRPDSCPLGMSNHTGKTRHTLSLFFLDHRSSPNSPAKVNTMEFLSGFDRDLPLRRLHSLGFISIAISTMRLLFAAALIRISAQIIRLLLLRSLLQDTLNGLAHQFCQNVPFPFDAFRQQQRNFLSNPFRWWYSFHGYGLFSFPILGMGSSLNQKDTSCSFVFTKIL